MPTTAALVATLGDLIRGGMAVGLLLALALLARGAVRLHRRRLRVVRLADRSVVSPYAPRDLELGYLDRLDGLK